MLRDKFVGVRLPSELAARAKSIASEDNRTLSNYILGLIKRDIESRAERLRETGTSYGTSPPQTPPDKKLRCAIAAAAVSTSYFVVTRKG